MCCTIVGIQRTGGGSVVFSVLDFRRKTVSKGLLRVGFTSLVIHTAMIGGVVYATLHAAPGDTRVRMDTTVVLLTPQAQQKPADPTPVQLVDALKGFQTVTVPAQIPTDIPPVDLQQRFDPKDYSGSGIEGGHASGMVVSGNEVYAESLVEERPALLSAPPPDYPVLLKQAGIQGRVILRAVIDTTGRVEPASVRIMKSPNPAFDQPTKDWVLKALFRPGRRSGVALPKALRLDPSGRSSTATSVLGGGRSRAVLTLGLAAGLAASQASWLLGPNPTIIGLHTRRPASRPMVLTLLESKRKTGNKRLFGVGFASLAIHSAMIASVVYATLPAAPHDDQVRMDATVVLLPPHEQQQAADPPPVQLADVLKGFQTVAVPAQIATDMPPVDLQQRFDPKDYSGG